MANERILIVEDNVALEARPWETVLKAQGYKVVGIAETEEDAVKMALRHKPSVVLMDIWLPDSRGKIDRQAGLRAAREIRAATGAQIVFVTGHLLDPKTLSEAHKTPDCQFLVKPVRREQLLGLIQLALARAKRSTKRSAKRAGLVFVCYSHKDKKYADEMMQFLRPLKKLGISTWIDSQIKPSQKWEVEIKHALAKAKAAVCLVSPSFVNSEFITELELPTLLQAEAERGLRVYPVYVHFVPKVILKPMRLLDFQGINDPDDPIDQWPPAQRNQDCWGILCKWLSS